MSTHLRNVYVDGLLSCGAERITATHLSRVEPSFSHDQITRLLHGEAASADALLRHATRTIKERKAQGIRVMIFDDTNILKPHAELSETVGYHFDHKEGRNMRGIGLLTALWSDERMSVPLMTEIIEKRVCGKDEKGRDKWVEKQNRNELFRSMLTRIWQSPARRAEFVLSDAWYASAENMDFIKEELGADFVMAIKSNRQVALSKRDAEAGKWCSLQSLRLGKRAQRCYLKGLDFPVLLVREVFKHGDDDKSGTLYLATSDLELKRSDILGLYQRRWKIEEYHRSLKQNCCVGGSQGYHSQVRKNHVRMAAFAFIRLEKARCALDKNHYQIMREVQEIATKHALKAIRERIPRNKNHNAMAA